MVFLTWRRGREHGLNRTVSEAGDGEEGFVGWLSSLVPNNLSVLRWCVLLGRAEGCECARRECEFE